MKNAEHKRQTTAAKPEPQPNDSGSPGQAAQAKTQKAAKRKMRIPPARNDPMRVVFDDAVKQDRGLKRKHRALFEADHKVFRYVIGKAHTWVFHMKPGPKDDPQITRAAREVAFGARVEDVFEREFPHRRPGDEDLYAMAHENFRGNVNKYIRNHSPLKRLRDRRVRSAAELVQPDSAHD